MTDGRIFARIYIFTSLSWAFFRKPEKLGSHTTSNWWLADPVTHWPSSISGVRRETRSQNVAFSVTAQNVGTLHGRRRCDGQRRTMTTNDMQQRHGLPVDQCVYWDCTVHPRSDSDGPGSSIVMLRIAGCVCDMYRTEDRITFHKLVVKHLHTKI